MQKIKKEEGITLIALVTTIVVLLILASITIGAVSGEGGLIGNANEAKEKTEIANEKEVVDRAVVEAMGKNKRGNLVRSELQDELDKITGEGETEVTIDEIDYGYFVKFLDSGRIYKVSRDGDVEYLGKEDDLLTQANIIANPESNTTPEFIQSVELTVETPIDIGEVDFMLVSAWSQDKNTAPEDSEFQVAQLTGEGRRRTTTVNSSASVEGDYYLWVRVVVGEIEKEECFGPYAIKDQTTLVATSSEKESTSTFLGMPIERGLIQSVEIKNTLVGTGHSLGDGNTYDVTEGEKGKYLGWYEQNENGYYDVTIAGEGKIVANRNSSYLFANIGYGITDEEVTITGLENLDTGLVTDMSRMFLNCKVQILRLNSFDTKNVTTLQATFGGCTNLELLEINNWDTSNVESMGTGGSDASIQGTFQNCSNLKNIELSNWNTSKVKAMGNMFRACSSLISLDLSNFDTSNVVGMYCMFAGCSNLQNLKIQSFDTRNVKDMSNMFATCKSITNLNVSNFNTSNVTDMQGMFKECSSLKELDLSSFTTEKVPNMREMFRRCSSLINLNVSNFNTNSVTNMSHMFDGCSSLTNIDISNFNTSSVTNMSYMFNGCSNLAELNVSSFNTSSVTNMSNMFYSCNALTELNVSDFDTSNVTSMESMFRECSSLTNLDVSSFNTKNVTDMGAMFRQCHKLTTLDLSNFNTEMVTNMWYMFYACSNLTKLNLNNFNTSNVTNWTSMLSGISTNIEIITNADTETWLREKFPNLTNIHQ